MQRNGRKWTAELILRVVVRGAGQQFSGRIEGLGGPLLYDVRFHVPLQDLEALVHAGETMGAPSSVIAGAAAQMVSGRYDLQISREDGALIGVPPADLDQALFQPIVMAIGLLLEKAGTMEGSFRVPLLDAEEMGQFKHPDDLIEFVRGLNA